MRDIAEIALVATLALWSLALDISIAWAFVVMINAVFALTLPVWKGVTLVLLAQIIIKGCFSKVETAQ